MDDRIGPLDGISIEQFAAFLEGNLPAEELQQVSDAIAADRELSEVLGDVMDIDEKVQLYEDQPALWMDELPDADYELPLVSVPLQDSDNVELMPVEQDGVDILESGADETQIEDNPESMVGNDGLPEDGCDYLVGGETIDVDGLL